MTDLSLEPRSHPTCMSAPHCSTVDSSPCLCLYDHLARQADGDAVATSQRLAVADSRAVIERVAPELAAGGQELAAAAAQVDSELQKLRTYLHQGQIDAAVAAQRTVAARHCVDGAFDRRRRPFPRQLAWLFITLAATFDTAFFGTLFQMLTNADTETPTGRLLTVIAYLPGLVLAGATLIAGIWLGDAVERARNRRSALPDADSTPPPWWPLPITFALLVITAVGVTAWARPKFMQWLAEETGGPVTGIDLPEWVVIILLISLTCTAICAELLTRNSFADADEEVENRAQAVRREYQTLVDGANRSVLRHEQSWLRLRGTLVAAWSNIEDLWAGVAWHETHVGGAPIDHREQTDHPFAQVIRHTPLPPPSVGPLFSAYEVLSRFPADESRTKLQTLTADGDSHWAS